MTETPELAGWAAKYAAAMLSVLPLHSIRDGRCTCRRMDCRTPGKHPLTQHGKDDASTDLAQVTEWWRRWSWANVGACPPAGVVVLDVDPRHGGDVELDRLTVRHGPLPDTLTAVTGSGGLHVWLAYWGPARGVLCPGVDVKTERGYLVMPPSLHLSGRRYQWVREVATASAPRWVRALLDPPRPATVLPHNVGGGGDGLVRVVATASPGERNNCLNWAAYWAYQHCGAPDVIVKIRAAALSVGLTAGEVDKTIRSAARAVLGG